MAVSILIGDVLERLAEIEPDSIDCVVTSPPYWGLRDYGVDGQIGLEPTLGEHLDIMVEVFEGVRRVLKPSGTLWLNYGDCYATSPNGRSAADTKAAGGDDRTFRDKPFSTIGGKLKPKDLCMIPNRLAIALQEAGWWVRSEIIWAKPNPMPESIKDRPATSHEKIFLLTKSARYFYNADAVRVERAQEGDANGFRGGSYVGGEPGPRQAAGNYKVPSGWDTDSGAHGSIHKAGRAPANYRRPNSPAKIKSPYGQGFSRTNDKTRGADVSSPRHAGHVNHTGIEATPRGEGRNLRNYEPAPLQVWVMATRPFSEAHFATFPPELAQRCLLAGCPPRGTVLDPFGGAGTVGLVAGRLGLDCTLIELKPEYAEIADRRLRAGLVEVTGVRADNLPSLPLFGGEAA